MTAVDHVRSGPQKRVDILHALLERFPEADCQLTHTFTPGLYGRKLAMPAGSVAISRVHKTEHQFVVLTGEALVWTEESGIVRVKAPFTGVTKPGTRRVLFIVSDSEWMTFHPTTETDLDKLQDELTETPDLAWVASDPEAQRLIVDQMKQLVGGAA